MWVERVHTSCFVRSFVRPIVLFPSMVPLRLSSSVSLVDFSSPRNGSHPFPITIHQVHELELIGTVISTISGVLLVPLLLINLIMKERRSFPSRLTTLYISMALGLHVTVLVGLITGTTDFFSFIRFHEVSEGCKIQGIFYQFFASATLWLWLLICSMLYCVIVRGMSFRELKRYEGYTHLFWAGLSTLQTVIPFADTSAEPQVGVPVCWMSHGNDYFNIFAFFLTEMMVCLLAGIAMMYKILQKLWLLRASGNASPNTRKAVVDYMVRHILFLVFFIGVFTVLTICTIFEYRFNVDPKVGLPYWICMMHVCSACGVGIFTFIVFGTSKGTCDIFACLTWLGCLAKSQEGPDVSRGGSQGEEDMENRRAFSNSYGTASSSGKPAGRSFRDSRKKGYEPLLQTP